jgi:hypothetical protein
MKKRRSIFPVSYFLIVALMAFSTIQEATAETTFLSIPKDVLQLIYDNMDDSGLVAVYRTSYSLRSTLADRHRQRIEIALLNANRQIIGLIGPFVIVPAGSFFDDEGGNEEVLRTPSLAVARIPVRTWQYEKIEQKDLHPVDQDLSHSDLERALTRPEAFGEVQLGLDLFETSIYLKRLNRRLKPLFNIVLPGAPLAVRRPTLVEAKYLKTHPAHEVSSEGEIITGTYRGPKIRTIPLEYDSKLDIYDGSRGIWDAGVAEQILPEQTADGSFDMDFCYLGSETYSCKSGDWHSRRAVYRKDYRLTRPGRFDRAHIGLRLVITLPDSTPDSVTDSVTEQPRDRLGVEINRFEDDSDSLE